jgi:tRNA (mo5U34)-methyltransferase
VRALQSVIMAENQVGNMTPEDISTELQKLQPWFHRIDLGQGLFTKSRSAIGEPVEHPLPTWEKVSVCLPVDLSGKTVLDVGCNAGFYAIETKRRGAARVLGVDSQRNLIRQAIFVRTVLGLDIEYRRMSVYDLDPHDIGQFDVTLALGLIYHCKHLVLALERLFTITRELLILETAIYPPERAPASSTHDLGGIRTTLHPMAYVENPPDAKEAVFNWFLPGVNGLCALLRNIGFDDVAVYPGVGSNRAVLACRKLQPYPDSQMIGYLAAALSLRAGPTHCSVGEAVRFSILAENTGHARWLRGSEAGTDKGAIHLAAHLLDKDEEPISRYYAGAFLPNDIAPGQAVEIEIVLRAPDSPGDYLVEFDLVSENLAWFEDLGLVVLRHNLSVR